MQAQEFIILAGQLFVRSRTVWLERIKLVKRILKELGALRFLNGLLVGIASFFHQLFVQFGLC